MNVLSVVGARPQFIKAAIVSRALAVAGVREVVIHTGQHYDARMSDVFFHELGMREPDANLGIGSGPHGEQTGRMLAELERVIRDAAPDRVLVFGDTNSTIAGALAAAKLRVPVDHVEAGLRSFDHDMPEELNRVLTDRLSDQLFCPTQTAVTNLQREGIEEAIFFTGDTMLDLALKTRSAALARPLPDGLREGGYFLATIHRASNTDDRARLQNVIDALAGVGRGVAPVILPVHPRLAAALERCSISIGGVRSVDPVGYVAMQGLIARARGVITDSGGVQKEALFHGVPCITLRDATEWVESVDAGLNTLLGDSLESLGDAALAADGARAVPASVLSAFGDGRAGETIAAHVVRAGAQRRRWRSIGDVGATT